MTYNKGSQGNKNRSQRERERERENMADIEGAEFNIEVQRERHKMKRETI
jgi:hypothetical protein